MLLCAFVGGLGAQPQTVEGNVASVGESVVKATLAGKAVEVGLRTTKVERPNPGFPLALEGYDEVSIVRQIVVKVDDEEVWVPRSVYSDLFNVRKASLRLERGMFVLELVGADASDLYSTRTVFTAVRVLSRTVYSHGSGSRKMSEVTRYSQIGIVG